jgi:ATP-dependent Clp protease ATP-binding subunit ClpA
MSSNINTDEVLRCVRIAHQIADSFSHEYTTLEHLLCALMQEQDVQKMITTLGGADSLAELEDNLASFFDSGLVPTSNMGPIETDVLKNVIQHAVAQVMFSSRMKATASDLIVAMLQQDNSHATQFLTEQGISLETVKEYLSHGAGSQGADKGQARLAGGMSGGNEGLPSDINTIEDALKILGKFALNLNEEAEKGNIDPMIGRADEIDQLVVTTARRTKNNAVLIGDCRRSCSEDYLQGSS